MDTLSFFKKILPSQGIYVLAAFRGKVPAHSNHSTLESLAIAAQRINRSGVEVFHACASYSEALQKPSRRDPSKMRNATRVATNAFAVRSQWMDIDVGEGKDYATRKEAIGALMRFCTELNLPIPMIVSSGRGLHCYWPYTKDVSAAKAGVISAALAAAAKAKGFKHDTSRTADIASILRPAGTHWRKDGEREVKVIRDAEPVSPKEFLTKLIDFVQEPAPTLPSFITSEWSSGISASYPPSSAHALIQFCPTLREVADKRGDVQEPLWRAMLGLVKHTIEGEELAHEWSMGYPHYDERETQEKLDLWEMGPTTCEKFSELSDLCNNCSIRAKVKSPIQLGYKEDLPPPAPKSDPDAEVMADGYVPTSVDHVDYHANRMPDQVPFWPKHVAWDGTRMKRAMKDEDGQVEWVAFATKLFYPYLRFRQEDGTWAMKVCALVNAERNQWRTFDVPAKAIAENQAFANALGAYEVFSVGKNGKEFMKTHAMDVLSGLMAHNVETVTYNNFGWHDNGFVLGQSKLTPKGLEPVFLGSRVPPDSNAEFGVRGTPEEWAELINTIYNRPGAEPYQFIICAAFGAPLIKLIASDMWHGIPLALTGEGGLGKTTTCKVACSMYGDPRHFAISTNQEGSTLNALIQRVALMRNLPIVLDEMTGRTTQEIQGMLYALSNGKPKERSKSDGSLIGADLSWDTVSFITGNMSITNLLAQLDKQRADATQLRCFEIMLPDNFNEKVFRGINAKDMIEDQLLSRQFGAAGLKYLSYVMQKREIITGRLQRMRAKYCPNSQDETRERFYYDLMVTSLMGGVIATQLGLLSFDLEGVRRWAEKHIKTLRASRAASTCSVEDYFHAFLSDLHGRIVVTQKYGDGRLTRGKAAEFVEERSIRDPIARHAIEDRRFLVSTRGFMEWCVENNVNPGWFRDELDKRGFIRHVAGEKETRERLFKGTNLVGSLAKAIEFDYNKLDNMPEKPAHLKAVKTAVNN